MLAFVSRSSLVTSMKSTIITRACSKNTFLHVVELVWLGTKTQKKTAPNMNPVIRKSAFCIREKTKGQIMKSRISFFLFHYLESVTPVSLIP